MRTKRQLLLAAVLLGWAALAHAAPGPMRVVVLTLCVAEQVPERVEQTLTTPVERLLLKLPEVASLQSISAEGGARFEIHYKEGATRSDLRGVEEAIGEAVLDRGARILSRSAELGWPMPDGHFLYKPNCAAASHQGLSN